MRGYISTVKDVDFEKSTYERTYWLPRKPTGTNCCGQFWYFCWEKEQFYNAGREREKRWRAMGCKITATTNIKYGVSEIREYEFFQYMKGI